MPAKHPRPRFPTWARVLLSTVALGLAVWFVILPQFADAAATLHTLERISIPLLVLAVVCELGSLLSYTALTRTVFGKTHPPFFTLFRLDLVDLGINHVVPGGAPIAMGVRVSLFRSVGVRGAVGMSVTTIEIVVANLMLGALLGLGVALSLGVLTGSVWLLVAAAVVIGLVIATILATWRLVFHTESSVRAVLSVVSHVRFISTESVEMFLRTMARQLHGLLTRRSKRVRAIIFSALNWILDAAVLWIMLSAFGTPPPIGGVITVYAAGVLVSMLPITPGGLGVVEGFMVPALVLLGTVHSTALIAVLAWRLLEYWLPLPLAGLSWISLLVDRRRDQRPVASAAPAPASSHG
ncbi:MAG: flippase-like domain-containing protein [Actinomycetota bacterium]